MRFNLKNRPKASQILETMTKNQLMDYIEEMWEWFEGFEKELRERLTRLEQGKRKTDNAVVIASRLSLTYLIKEILGES